MTTTFLGLEKWDENQIVNRANLLADKAIAIWK